MNIINFVNHFPDEQSCEIYLKAHREKVGIRCKSCLVVASFSNAAVVGAGPP